MPLRKSHPILRGALAAAVLTAIAPAAASAACVQAPTTKAFSKFGDKADYSLAPGGTFEGKHGWTLTGAAKIVTGNETAGVTKGSSSLFLPLLSTATSPEFCVDETNPHFRFAMRSTLKGGYLAVVLWRNKAGKITEAQFTSSAYVTKLSENWAPSSISPLATKIKLAAGESVTAQIKFISTGNQNYKSTNILGSIASNVVGSVYIDSVMVDPYRRG